MHRACERSSVSSVTKAEHLEQQPTHHALYEWLVRFLHEIAPVVQGQIAIGTKSPDLKFVEVNLIAGTTTTKGQRVRAALDTEEYPTGIKVDDATMASAHLIPDEFHGEWNYAIIPAESGRNSKQPRMLRAKL